MREAVVHIVPHLPPPPEGVGSFALGLAEALRDRFGIESRFLIASPSCVPGPYLGKAPTLAAATSADPETFFEALAKVTGTGDGRVPVLLHYANYGYEPRGCPSWLVRGLAKWKAGNRNRLVTAFHEVHAFGPPWRSSFWLSPRQRRLAASLARLSDGLATSMQLYQRILKGWAPAKNVAVLPVFSTVGEPLASPPLETRSRRMVVFGGAGTRRRAYRDLRPAIESACRKLAIDELCDIGPGDLNAINLSVGVRQLGTLPETEVSAMLLGSVAGFVGYPMPFLPKSTIFAAYCAHRVLPICAWPAVRREPEPLPPFWSPQSAAARWEDLQTIADQANAWYCGHNLDHHVTAYRDLLLP